MDRIHAVVSDIGLTEPSGLINPPAVGDVQGIGNRQSENGAHHLAAAHSNRAQPQLGGIGAHGVSRTRRTPADIAEELLAGIRHAGQRQRLAVGEERNVRRHEDFAAIADDGQSRIDGTEIFRAGAFEKLIEIGNAVLVVIFKA